MQEQPTAADGGTISVDIPQLADQAITALTELASAMPTDDLMRGPLLRSARALRLRYGLSQTHLRLERGAATSGGPVLRREL